MCLNPSSSQGKAGSFDLRLWEATSSRDDSLSFFHLDIFSHRCTRGDFHVLVQGLLFTAVKWYRSESPCGSTLLGKYLILWVLILVNLSDALDVVIKSG